MVPYLRLMFSKYSYFCWGNIAQDCKYYKLDFCDQWALHVVLGKTKYGGSPSTTLVWKCFLKICPSLAQTCAPMMLMDGLLASFHQLILVAIQCSWYVQYFLNLFIYQLQLCCNIVFLGHWIADIWGFYLYNFESIYKKQNSFCRYFLPFQALHIVWHTK